MGYFVMRTAIPACPSDQSKTSLRGKDIRNTLLSGSLSIVPLPRRQIGCQC